MLDKVVKDIKELRIQGATNVAEESLKALLKFLKKSRAQNQEELIREAEKAKKKLFEARVTEPLMRNIVRRVLFEIKYNYEDSVEEVVERGVEEAKEVLEEFKKQKQKVYENAEKIIKDNTTIFTHCHSSSVTSSILLAKKKGKNVKVICTETRPKYQGRKTAKELVKGGVDTTMVVDDAALKYLKEADIMLIGADAITHDGSVVNKIGTGLISLAAEELKKKVYVITPSLKYDPETTTKEEPIEYRKPSEVWKKAPKNLIIKNPAFEEVPSTRVHRIVTELGALKPKQVKKKVKKYYKWTNL